MKTLACGCWKILIDLAVLVKRWKKYKIQLQQSDIRVQKWLKGYEFAKFPLDYSSITYKSAKKNLSIKLS